MALKLPDCYKAYLAEGAPQSKPLCSDRFTFGVPCSSPGRYNLRFPKFSKVNAKISAWARPPFAEPPKERPVPRSVSVQQQLRAAIRECDRELVRIRSRAMSRGAPIVAQKLERAAEKESVNLSAKREFMLDYRAPEETPGPAAYFAREGRPNKHAVRKEPFVTLL